MISLLIVAHAPLAGALRAAALHAFPDAAERVAAYDVPPGADVERYEADAEAQLASLPPSDVLVLTDLYGATPARVAGRLAERRGLGAIAGVNLMMLLRAVGDTRRSPAEAFERALAGGVESIVMLHAPAAGPGASPAGAPETSP